MVSRWLFALVLAAVPFTAAAEEEVVAASSRPQALSVPETGAAKSPTTPVTKSVTVDDQVRAWLADAPPVQRQPSDRGSALWPDDSATGGRTVHGSAGVSIGTGGYRSGYVTSIIPLGENGTLGLSFSKTDFGDNAYGYDGYGYDGYGYNRYGNPWGRRTGSHTSAAISIDLSQDSGSAESSNDCVPGFRNGTRNVEPVWARRTRDRADCYSESPFP